jgi:WD40 repeat protein
MPEGFLSPGQVLGDRYQIRSQLGRGGMGEVWRAFDLKLRVEVALKALLPDLFKDERRRDLLRREVRAAREVMSPNVCRIFDLIEIEGRELVSMEYVDGATLLGVLQERGPLDLKEAQDIASQFLAGLEAIHKVGLIHRDIKPENIMLTRAGRVVVMDFGLARQDTEGGGTVSGTPAYMAPEQAAGQTLDPRADVYSAGVVLAEMVSPEGIKSFESRQSVWEGVRSEPAKLPDSPWAPVLKRAVAKDREGRFNTAHTLTRALEDVTLRVEGAEDLHPYPGLASFTEADAEYFFGREAEVEAIWRRLEGAHLLAIVGASGAGKTSFIGAGLRPNAPPGWRIARCTPGNAAISSLRRMLIHELTGDAEALELLVDSGSQDSIVEAATRWRRNHGQTLLVIDQFEELFTQNPSEEQARFATVVGQLVVEADVRVLLSMRDDFLLHCNRHEALRPLFATLTPLDPPAGAALRRAVIQPALKCGYRFEDDELVEEMLAEVEGERGALPLLAFAAARLWEKRDRETGHLTRQAYQDIGGVGGALARHAEATMDRIGTDRITIVRELFRNLVTAEGTRAVREWNELLSIFDRGDVSREGINPSPTKEMWASEKRNVGAGFIPAREAAEEVLRELIDSRLLTSYEVREDEHEPTRRVEIIHESLLANWPRLVRWQTQDQEGAQLRDELRQAARSWDEHGRHDDRLWTGTAFREYQLWLERYPGGLTLVEEAFSSAMTSLATRRKRRRRLAVAASIVVIATIAAIFANLWRRSVEGTRRAEAAGLIALGQIELDSYPTATVAHVIASLERSDSTTARRLVLETLWKGPIALVASEESAHRNRFSPDGRSLVMAKDIAHDTEDAQLTVFRADGSSCPFVNAHEPPFRIFLSLVWKSGHFWTGAATKDADTSAKIALWSFDQQQPLAETTLRSSESFWAASVDSSRERLLLLLEEDNRIRVDALGFDGTKEQLGKLNFEVNGARFDFWNGSSLGAVADDQVFSVEVGNHDLRPPHLLGRHEGAVSAGAWDPLRRFMVSAGEDGRIFFWHLSGQKPPFVVEGLPNLIFYAFAGDNGAFFWAGNQVEGTWIVRIWDMSADRPRLIRNINLGEARRGLFRMSPSGRFVARSGPNAGFCLWPIDAPADIDPILLSRGDNARAETFKANFFSFHAQGDWIATTDYAGLAFWPLRKEYPLVIQHHRDLVSGLAFAPDGSWIASASNDGTVRSWPLVGNPPPRGSTLFGADTSRLSGFIAASPDGRNLIVETTLIPLDGSSPTILEGFSTRTFGVAFSQDGRFAAAGGDQLDPGDKLIRIWDMVTGDEVAGFETEERPDSARTVQFLPNGQLLSSTESGLWRWDIETGVRTHLCEGDIVSFAAGTEGQRVLMIESESGTDLVGKVVLLDVESGTAADLERFGNDVMVVASDPTASIIATGDRDGEVRIGLVDGGEPHLLLGHEGLVQTVAIDPQGRWIASGGQDKTVRLWPMPDLSKPPLHTLPHDELIAKLKTLTNLRVVRDPESPSGWTLTHDPFPGWETVPSW